MRFDSPIADLPEDSVHATIKEVALHILQSGLAVTFIWIGIFILQNPMNSAHLILPWVLPLLSLSIERIMFDVAVADIVIGMLLLHPRSVWLGSLLATMHLLFIFFVTGVNSVTVRNIGLTAGSLALFLSVPAPRFLVSFLHFRWRDRTRNVRSSLLSA